MASMRESDTGLWLHNKLGATDELWAPPSIASLLTAAVIDNIRLCFHGLSSAVKLKLLLGTLHLPRRTVDEMKGALTEIIQLAALDSDPWVLMVADILKSFPDTGSLNLDLEEQNPNVQDILGELREKATECEASAMLPLECRYLNKSALTTLAGPLTPPEPRPATVQAEGAHVQQRPEPSHAHARSARLTPDAHHTPGCHTRYPGTSSGHGGPTDPATCPAAAQEESVPHEGADVRRAGNVQDRQQSDAAREGPHSGLHGWLPREPLPGAGRGGADQAQRAHGGPAQGRRPGQHRHAGGHSLRDELHHGPVDALQEVQAHGQRVLGPPACRCASLGCLDLFFKF
uniref:Negative elongation factor complex member A n=1 Tax=Molossus molossus TaxID=27622 RepID=A0A7J8JYZ1_MOLMO|nr:negative elongation factor complex member A [Molossus molossus]